MVLSYPKARIIDENGKPLQDYDLQLKTNSPNPSKRFGELLRGHECFEIFGLTPVSALKLTPLIGNYGHGDGVLLARLALQGRFHEIPEYLLFPRRHPQSSYIIELYEQEWLNLDPKVVVINLGTNDTRPDWFALNLGRIIVMSLRAGIQPILLLEPNSLENKTNFLFSRHELMRVVGESRGVPVIDMHSYLRDKYDEGFLWWDFVHLADFGQDLFAEKLYNELEQILL